MKPTRTHTIDDCDIIGYGVAEVKISAGLMHVLIKPNSPSFNRIKLAMKTHIPVWDSPIQMPDRREENRKVRALFMKRDDISTLPPKVRYKRWAAHLTEINHIRDLIASGHTPA